MVSRVGVFVIVGAAALGLSRVSIQAGQDTTKTTWDGVYSTAQATKGEAGYNEYCAKCHGAAAMGSDAPSLADPGFAADWDTQTLVSLFDRVQKTMPLGAEGTLSRAQAGDIVAYILQRNNFPAGDADLSADAGPLSTIKYVATKPQ